MRMRGGTTVVDEPQVYVNNMNSCVPTTIIPDSVPSAEFSRNAVSSQKTYGRATFQSVSNYEKPSRFSTTTGEGGFNRYSSLGSGKEIMTNEFAKRINRDEEEKASNGVILSNGEELHNKLQDAYSRIMRRLQREQNYEKIHQVPLATEFGIEVPESKEEKTVLHSDKNQGCSAARKKISTAFLSDSKEANLSECSGSMPGSPRSKGNRHLSEISSLPNSPSQPLLRDQARRYEGKRNMTSFRVEECKKEEVGDIEYSLSQQPCPETLRLVIQYLATTVLKKMELAMRGSLRDVFCYSFDCKTLFDRLLKEIPGYLAFQGNAEMLDATKVKPAPSRGTTALQMQEMYQELRKVPAVLPRGDYARDAATGAVVVMLKGDSGRTSIEDSSVGNSSSGAANDVKRGPSSSFLPHGNTAGHEIVTATENAKSRISHRSTLSQTQALSAPLLTSMADGTTVNGGPRSSFGESEGEGQWRYNNSYESEPDVELPLGYGKSARIYGYSAEDQNYTMNSPSHRNQTTMMSAGREGNYSSWSKVMQEKPPFHLGGHYASGEGGHMDSKGGAIFSGAEMMGPNSPSGVKERSLGAISGGMRTVPLRQMDFNQSSRLAYEAMMTSVGTLTDEYSENIVTKEQYEKLFQHVQLLEVQIAEAKRETNDALSSLLEEKNQTQVRARIVKYLRETIFRECNVLRSRLALAEQKEHFNHVYQQQQQQSLVRPGSFNHPSPACSPSFSASAVQSGLTPSTRLPTAQSDHSAASSLRRKMSTSPRLNTANTTGSRVGGFSEARVAGSMIGDTAAHEAFHLSNSEIGKVQSLVDLAFLAVETESVLTDEQWKTGIGRHASNFRNPKQEMDDMLAVHEERQRVLKERLVALKIYHNHAIMAKDQEIARLRILNDAQRGQRTMMASVQELKESLQRMKNGVYEQLSTFRSALLNSFHTLGNKIAMLSKEISNYSTLKCNHCALLDLVKSAQSLFMPMLTAEYTHGYHPWPAKIRNTLDPLAHILQTHCGPAEVFHLRETLARFSEMYIAIHKFSTSTLIIPDPSRPTSGKQLTQICSAMVLSPLATIDLIYTIRIRYDKEVQLRKSIARLNFQILWKAHLQRVLTERCVGALIEGEMDPHTTVMPIARKVNYLAEERAQRSCERSALQKERLDNAKELYGFWRDRQIDIYEGDAIPKTQNRVGILNSAQSYSGGLVGRHEIPGVMESRRASVSLKRNSLLT